MFVLATVADNIKIEPDSFDRDQVDVLTDQIDRKFANKVLANVGLCICLWDFEHIGEAFIYPADGAAHYKARFRLVVLRPFPDEVLLGKVSGSSPDGVNVSLGMFEDVTIPPYLLQTPSSYEAQQEDQLWVWRYEGAEYVVEHGSPVLFKVRTLHFAQAATKLKNVMKATSVSEAKEDPTKVMNMPRTMATFSGHLQALGLAPPPPAKGKGAALPSLKKPDAESEEVTLVEEAEQPMHITASINEQGLGLMGWW